MKKVIALIMAFAMTLSLCACSVKVEVGGNKKGSDEPTSSANEESKQENKTANSASEQSRQVEGTTQKQSEEGVKEEKEVAGEQTAPSNVIHPDEKLDKELAREIEKLPDGDSVFGEGNESKEIAEPDAGNKAGTKATDENAFYVVSADGGVEITGCNSSDANIVIPETISGLTVVGISERAFKGSTYESIKTPGTVRTIGSEAFADCKNLKAVDLSYGLEVVGVRAFANCPALRAVSFPTSTTTLQGTIFYDCPLLEEVYVPSSVTTMPVGVIEKESCPKTIIATESGSTAETDCIKYGVPYYNVKMN